MEFHFAEFIKAINDTLPKMAEDNTVFDIPGAVFPNINTQTKWHFAKTNDQLHLNDGSRVYRFHLPEGEQEYDFPLAKLENSELHEFGKDAINRGTVQVHRADPGSIYFTMQDGSRNPTYTFKHISGEKWRAIPKPKKNTPGQLINKEAFLKGAEDALSHEGLGGLLDKALSGVNEAGRGAVRGTMALGHDPLLSAGAGLLGGAVYDVGKRSLYNTPEENEQETTSDRLARYLLPSAALGLTGSVAKATFPNYYSHFPEYRP